MEEQQGDQKRTGVRRSRRARSMMRREQNNQHTLLAGILVLLLFINTLPIGIYWNLDRGLESSFALVLSQSVVLLICTVLIWRHRPHENPTQYFLIAVGFYLLAFGLCMSGV
jgi:hypothetical protein